MSLKNGFDPTEFCLILHSNSSQMSSCSFQDGCEATAFSCCSPLSTIQGENVLYVEVPIQLLWVIDLSSAVNQYNPVLHKPHTRKLRALSVCERIWQQHNPQDCTAAKDGRQCLQMRTQTHKHLQFHDKNHKSSFLLLFLDVRQHREPCGRLPGLPQDTSTGCRYVFF